MFQERHLLGTCSKFEGDYINNIIVEKRWINFCFYNNNDPGAPLTNFNDGEGGRQRFIFYTQKNHNFRIFLSQKKSLLFLAYPKKSLCFFRDPKKSLLAKISDPKKLLGPPPPPSLTYVSEAPGNHELYIGNVLFVYNRQN